ncbi:MAG: HYR domain-containing protein, partial [Thermoleophilia bacterium]|nr:HYR domain-containing protein [Thermoleophilia bacterium]
VPDPTPPTLNVPDAIVVNANSPLGATATYVATATDSAGSPVTPACSKASGALFPIGITTVTCTASDARGNTSAAKTITVQVKGAVVQLVHVLRVVQSWKTKSNLPESRIKQMIRALTQPRPAVSRACRLIGDRGAFGKELSAGQRASVRAELARIYDVVGCSRALKK